MTTTRFVLAVAMAGALAAVGFTQPRSGAPVCDPGNGGITLPDGFCAAVFADDVGRARQLEVASNGDVYVAMSGGRGSGGVVALRDADGDGHAEVRQPFGEGNSTGIEVHNGALYVARVDAVVRHKMRAGQLTPEPQAEVVVSDLPQRRQHADKGMAFDGSGSLFVNIGAPSNSCQAEDRKPGSPGQDPCPLLDQFGGIWRFDADRAGQTFGKDGKRYATGMRQMIALAWHQNALYAAMHGRDQLNTLWPDKFTAEQNAILPSETLNRVEPGSNFGWPYCHHDWQQNALVLSPEYGGDGKAVERCAQYTRPVAAFPGHWAPNDLLFYTATQFPPKYRGGAFIAFHGSWNRAPLPQDGYSVVFVPFTGTTAGKYEIFADGFAGKKPLERPNDAAFRPMGLAVGPDGSLYVSDSEKGRIWKIAYRGR
jgi:glucose/arabinose dehydrogenase